MTVVYVREQGAVMRKEGGQLKVTQGERTLFRIPLANLDQVVLMGNAQLTTQAAVLLLQNQVDVVFLSAYGKYRGRLLNNESRQAQLRHQQLRLCDDEHRCLEIAARIVAGKVANQRVVLQRRIEENDPEAARSLQSMLKMLDAATTAQNLDQLRGYEGKAAAHYFEGVRGIFPADWGFRKRAYYPPPDPANALLSFIYTLLMKDVEAKIQLVGLDTYLGFFHMLGYNRPALALDIMEEFRPSIADIVALTLVRNRQITLEDFETTQNPELPVRLSRRALEIVMRTYEDRLGDRVFHPLANGQVDYRRAIEYQVRQIARVIRGEAQHYEPLVMR